MNKIFAITAVLALMCLGLAAQANVFNLGTGITNLETVAVGNPGNAGEHSGSGAGGYGYDRICGSVDYNYNIGKYEVTAAQYADFLNNKAKSDSDLYNTNMASGCGIQRGSASGSYTYSVDALWANRPVNYVSYWDSLRFANWLGNGQGDGSTETGAYTLGGYNGIDGRAIHRNPGRIGWAVTSEDEWYKAAYYDPNKAGGAGYWDYPTSSDTAPGRDMADSSGNNANSYNNGFLIGSPYYRTEVGEFQNSDSPYGTFDQGGNVFEWNETIIYEFTNYAYRGLRGGSFGNSSYYLQSMSRSDYDFYYLSTFENDKFGFRVSEVVPEPSSLIALAGGSAWLTTGGLLSLLGIRRRRANTPSRTGTAPTPASAGRSRAHRTDTSA